LSIAIIIAMAIAHNVPAVYDGFATRKRACKARPGLQNCGWSRAWEWRSNDL